MRRRILPALAAFLLAGALAACAPKTIFMERMPDPTPTAAATQTAGEARTEHWVIVSFADTEQKFDLQLMDAMLDTELRADEALRDAGIGYIDGNEIGDYSYDLYFVGDDGQEMWRILEPIFDEAPARWSRVELWRGSKDPAPVVILPR